MENFLQKVSSQKESSKSKYDQQKILQKLQAMQLENFKLLRTVQELEREIEYLMINSQENEIGNKQAENVKIDQLETKFNQFAELTESMLLSKLSMNDPMEVGQQIPTTCIPYLKITRCWYYKEQDTKQETVTNSNKDKRVLQTINGKIFQDLLYSRRQNLQKKILQLNKEAPYIQRAINEFNKK